MELTDDNRSANKDTLHIRRDTSSRHPRNAAANGLELAELHQAGTLQQARASFFKRSRTMMSVNRTTPSWGGADDSRHILDTRTNGYFKKNVG
jgi:hypothetical protein